MRRVSARKRLEPVLDHAGGDIGPLVGIADHPPRLKIEPRCDLDHAHARARPQRLDDHVEDNGLSDPHGKHHQRPARELVGLGRAREAIDDKVGGDDQHKRQHQLNGNEFTANPQGRNDLVAGQANVDEDAEHGEPFAPSGIGTCRAHEHNACDARRQLKRQLAGGLDKAAVHAADIEQRARDLIIEETAHAQTKAQDNRDNGDIFLIDVSEHAFLSVGRRAVNLQCGETKIALSHKYPYRLSISKRKRPICGKAARRRREAYLRTRPTSEGQIAQMGRLQRRPVSRRR